LAERAKKAFPAGTLGNFDAGVFISRGKGSRVWDQDGKEYLDYLMGSGPLILGHSHPEVIEAVASNLDSGTTFMANNPSSLELAEEIINAVACAEQVRFLSSGSEADMYAVRLARAYTGKDKIIKFEGGYHGMGSEAQMSLAPTKLANFPQAVPDSAGIQESIRRDTLVAPFNDISFLESLLDEYEGEIAAVFMEPFQRVIPPEEGFLDSVRALCNKHDALLIFDEIVTGFRFSYGGAQEVYGVVPDICTLGKIIGGGFPLAAITGKKDIMDHFDKSVVGNDKWLMMMGTLSGNPIASIAGLKTLEILQRKRSYDLLYSHGERIMDICRKYLDLSGLPYQVVGHPTLFDIVFTDKTVKNYRDVFFSNSLRNLTFNKVLREGGLFKTPTKLYPSLVLTEEDFELTEEAVRQATETISSIH
ncbi:MAG: aminotransferase class III-fold pyridoxal phosphate-dependent enzyme, partial [Rhodobacteraceae bacterium]|nr:aminotransferase class III-fold pyridoxal phosphate-dependent enzyme [Paracoccaceae bacterium]